MRTAFSVIRDGPNYRKESFHAGLKAVGFNVVDAVSDSMIGASRPGDVFVCWNRYSKRDTQAQKFELAGAAVIVAENGYIGATEDEVRKPFTASGEQLYAISLWHHNGAGLWEVGASGRWREQGIEVKPWRKDGDHVLVVPQRGLGPTGVQMPPGWIDRTMAKLKARTKRPVMLKKHPGNYATTDLFAPYLENAWCVVTWGSTGAIKALCQGIPVFSDFPKWIGYPAATPMSEDIERPFMDDRAREFMLDRLAWNQWTTSEIVTGEPFTRLMTVYERWLPGGRLGGRRVA